MPIRILQVVTHMNRGGLETMIMNYYRRIDRSKVQFDFLVHRTEEAAYDAEILALGGKIYRLSPMNPLSRRYLSKLDSFFSDHQEYRIVHCHLDCMAGIPLKYAKKHGVPVRIAHSHNSSQTRDVKYPLKLFYKRNIPHYATDLFACGEDAGRWMFGTEKFTVLNNAIDASAYCCNAEVAGEIRRELGIASDALVVGHVGRFCPPKNHSFLIDVFSRVLKQRPGSVLVLVGGGELQHQAELQVRKLGIEKNVIFTGVRSDVPRLLQAMDVFQFPSIYEGLPVSIVEAQAAGLPCLISDKVPIECKKTDLVKQISLAESVDAWADAVLDAAKVPRRNTLEEIRAAGFDIAENAKWLEEYYLSKQKENN